jgi:hypothetical protein
VTTLDPVYVGGTIAYAQGLGGRHFSDLKTKTHLSIGKFYHSTHEIRH